MARDRAEPASRAPTMSTPDRARLGPSGPRRDRVTVGVSTTQAHHEARVVNLSRRAGWRRRCPAAKAAIRLDLIDESRATPHDGGLAPLRRTRRDPSVAKVAARGCPRRRRKRSRVGRHAGPTSSSSAWIRAPARRRAAMMRAIARPPRRHGPYGLRFEDWRTQNGSQIFGPAPRGRVRWFVNGGTPARREDPARRVIFGGVVEGAGYRPTAARVAPVRVPFGALQ